MCKFKEKPKCCNCVHSVLLFLNQLFLFQNIDIEDELTHVDVHPYACGVCNKSYTNQGSLRKHKRIHSEAQAFSCDVCNKLFMHENDVEEHRRIHTG